MEPNHRIDLDPSCAETASGTGTPAQAGSHPRNRVIDLPCGVCVAGTSKCVLERPRALPEPATPAGESAWEMFQNNVPKRSIWAGTLGDKSLS